MIGFGALAGGLTNAVAIWMLFHPYEPKGVKLFKLHGAIPKNKPRLAKTIGRTVGQRLLTSDDLARQLSAPAIRQAFEDAVTAFVRSMLETERGSLRETLPAGLLTEIEGVIDQVGTIVTDRVTEYAATDGFQETVTSFLTRATEEVRDRPIGALLTEARRTAIRARVEQWIGEATQSPELDRVIEGWINRKIVDLAGDHTPLIERLPAGLVAAVEKEIADSLPKIIDRVASVLGDPASRRRVQRALHDLFQRFVRDLMLHERIVARLVVTENTVARLLDKFEQDGADQVVEVLRQPEMRSQVAKNVNDAMVGFLRRPLADHIERLGPERLEGVQKTIAEHIIAALRDPKTREYGVEKLDNALESTEKRTWGDLLRYLPPEQAAAWLQDASRSERVQEWIADGTRTALRSLLDRRIGKPADWLPEGAVDRLASQLSPVLWEWTQSQVPGVVAKIDLETMVEEKVLSFSLERMEEIVRRTTQRELDLIVRLGYVLGAIVGTVAYVISLFI